MNYFPKNLRHLRRKKGENQADLAKLVNKKQNTIGNWENAVSEPGIRELTMLSNYFGVSLEDLVSKNLELTQQKDQDPSAVPGQASTPNEYLQSEQPDTWVRENGHDQFWVVVRELRRLDEKLDQIKLLISSPTEPAP